MVFLLPKNVRRKVDEEFSNNPVFSLLNGPWTRMFQGHMFNMSSADVFYHMFNAWDNIRENPQSANAYCEYFADNFCKEFEDEFPKADKSDIKFATAVVMQSLCECFLLSDDAFYINLGAILRTQVNKIDCSYSSMLHNKFAYAYRRTDSSPFIEFIKTYIETDEFWYSDDINIIFENSDGEENEEDEERFTNQQLVLLFEYLLDESLSSEYTNINGLASFISCVSGKSAGSIRQSIMSRSKKGVNKNDARRVASALRTFCPEKADDILNDNVDNL